MIHVDSPPGLHMDHMGRKSSPTSTGSDLGASASASLLRQHQLGTSRRSRSGCDTCKKRRVKCDEGKPICKRCLRGNRQCAYTTTPRNQLLVESNWSSSVSVTRCDPQLASPVLVDFGTLREQSQRFVEQWISPLEVVQSSNITQGQSAIWSQEWRDFLIFARTLLRDEPVFGHLENVFATVNIATWHTDICKSHEVFYLQELDTVLSSLRNRPPRHYDDAVMICTIIVGHCEFIRTAGYQAGLAHLEAGFRIISEWELYLGTLSPAARATREDIIAKIKPALFCNRMVASAFGWPADMKMHVGPGCSVGPVSQIPAWFSSVDMAINSVENFMLFWVMQLSRSVSWVEQLERQALEQLLGSLHQALTTINQGLLSSSDFHVLYFLRSHCRIAGCMLAASQRQFEEDQEEEMETVVADMEWLLRHRAGWDHPGNRIKESLGFIAPGFFVATQTKRLTLRNKALMYLKRLECTEGAWSSHLAFRIAEGIAAIEDTQTPPVEGAGGLLKLNTASCEVHDIDGQAQPVLTLRVDALPRSGSGGTWNVRLPDAEDHDACIQACWPLMATVKSWGYFGANRFPTPYLQTPAATNDRLEMHRAEGCAPHDCCGGLVLDKPIPA